MYRKYVRKWWLCKRNRIICPEFWCICKSQICLDKRKLWSKWLKKKSHSEIFAEIKTEIFWKFAWKNRKFWEISVQNSKFFYPDPRPPDFKPDWRRCCSVTVIDGLEPVALFYAPTNPLAQLATLVLTVLAASHAPLCGERADRNRNPKTSKAL